MLKVAITGNIASGKSTVEQIIASKGFKVYDTDKIAHEILASSDEVKKEFGTNDRKKIADIVFSNAEKLKQLEAIIHPQVKDELMKIFSEEEKLVFVSVPQLFETGFDKLFDKIIFVTADEKIRLERLMKRNSFTKEVAQKRINAQKANGKQEKSDYVIENNGDINALDGQVDEILDLILIG